ncbi:MAG: hypothetical protein IJ365_03985, partial [Clostridia bacterium]|nr:hypothetical protein [Clostridia bacterium]
SSKAEERRHIFEEASGITKYKYRKADAEKKLLAADDNLLRIKDIIVTMSEQLGPLENQAKKARKYRDLYADLKQLDINISIRKIDRQREALAEGKEKFNIAYNHLNSEKTKLHTLEESIEQKTVELNQINEQITQIREQAFAIEKGSGSLEGRIGVLENSSKNNHENTLRWQGEIKVLHERIKSLEQEKQDAIDHIKDMNDQKAQLDSKINSGSGELAKLEEQINAAHNESEELKTQILELLGEISAIKARSSSMDVLLKNFDERKESLASDMEQKQNTLSEAAQRLEELDKKRTANSDKRTKADADMEKLKNEYFAVVKKLDEAKAAQNSFVSQLNEKQSRKNILEDLEKGYEGYAKSVKYLLNRKIPGVDGVVSKLIEVEDAYITAIEIALGNMLQNIVVSDEEVAKKCIAQLKESRAGRATFLPLTSVKGELMNKPPVGDKGFVGIASQLVKYDKKYDGIIKSLLGRTVIADNIDNAVAMAKRNGYRFKIVTLDGQLLNPGGSMTGGSVGKNQSLLSRARDIEQLAEKIAHMRKRADKADDEIAGYKAQINKMADAKQQIEDTIKECEHEEVRIKAQIASDRRVAADAEADIKMLTNESGDIINEIADIEKQKGTFKEDIGQREDSIRQIRAALTKIDEKGIELSEQREAHVAKGTDDKIMLGNIDKDISVANERIAQIDVDTQNFSGEIDAKTLEINHAGEENKAILAEIEAIKQQIENAKQNSSELFEQVESGQKQYDEGSAKLQTMQKELKSQNDIIYELQQEVVRLESKNTKTEEDTEH